LRKNAGRDQPPRKTRILIVDDHPVLRQGIRMLIADQPDLEICGEADDAAGAVQVVEQSPPDVAIIDLTLKESSGLDLIKDLQTRHPKLRILVLSMKDEAYYAERVLRLGAKGYVNKQEAPTALIGAIRKVLNDEIFVSEKMMAHIVARIAGGAGVELPAVNALTDRELEIFELIGAGLETTDIAKRLHISPHTVDSHREHIKQKLNVSTASELRKHAMLWAEEHQGS
jgi:DNA-binding NarL/FixJ family response regulator